MAKTPTTLAPLTPGALGARKFDLDLSPSVAGASAIALLAEVRGIAVKDKASHETALTSIARGKTYKRDIVEHWKPVKRVVNDVKNKVLAAETGELAAAVQALTILEGAVLPYMEAERRRHQIAQDKLREKAEAEARERRALEIAKMEADALAAEEASTGISPRERQFAETMAQGMASPEDAARYAGYKDPEKQSARLMDAPKIIAAIDGLRAAAHVREQAAAVAATPLDVKAKQATSKLASVKGVHTVTRYGASCVNLAMLVDAVGANGVTATAIRSELIALAAHLDTDVPLAKVVLAGIIEKMHANAAWAPPLDTLMENGVKLNEYGRMMQKQIDQWPGVAHRVDVGFSGR